MQFHGFTFNSCLITQSCTGSQRGGLMDCDGIVKRLVNKCHSVRIVMQPEITCHITPLKLLFITQVMRDLRAFHCLSVCKSCQGLALKLPAHSHSSHFIKLQASEPHKCWKRLCQCVCFFQAIVSIWFMESRSPRVTREQDMKAQLSASTSQTSCPHFKRVAKLPHISSLFTFNGQHG